MSGREPVGFIDTIYNSGSGEAEGTELIRCVDGHKPQYHKIWTFGEDSVTREVHPKARVDVSAGFFEEFATDYLTKSWCRVHMFGRNFINESVEWLGVPDFHRTDGPAWTANILAHHPSWGDRGSSTNPNWVSKSGGYSGGVSISWNFPVHVLPVYHRRFSENTRTPACRVCDDLLRVSCLACMQSPST